MERKPRNTRALQLENFRFLLRRSIILVISMQIWTYTTEGSLVDYRAYQPYTLVGPPVR